MVWKLYMKCCRSYVLKRQLTMWIRRQQGLMHRYRGVDTSSDSMSVTNGLLVMGLFHYTNARWLTAASENQGSCSAFRCWRSCLSRPKLLLHSERHPHILLVPWEWRVENQLLVWDITICSSVWMNEPPGTPQPNS